MYLLELLHSSVGAMWLHLLCYTKAYSIFENCDLQICNTISLSPSVILILNFPLSDISHLLYFICTCLVYVCSVIHRQWTSTHNAHHRLCDFPYLAVRLFSSFTACDDRNIFHFIPSILFSFYCSSNALSSLSSYFY